MRIPAALLFALLGWGLLMGGTPTPAAQPATLPATWTPTYTPTASTTPTPTLTPTITPTLSHQQECASFEVFSLYGTQTYYPYDNTFVLMFGTPLTGVTARFSAIHRLDGTGVGIPEIERVQENVLNLPIAVLPRHGLYDWRLELLEADGTVLCTESGIFIAGLPITPTATVPVTETPEAAVTVITTTPVVIIVTATPEPSETP